MGGDQAPGGDDAPASGPVGPEGLSDEERAILLRVVEVLRKINYGTVLLVVQDGKVIQIETAEKFRLR